MKWFNYSEFDSPDEPGSGHHMEQDFLDLLDEARTIAGIPFVITSGFRTEAFHDELTRRGYSTAKNSAHLKGCAADIAATTSRDRFLIVTALLEVGLNRLGFAEDYIHVDNDWEKNENLCWLY